MKKGLNKREAMTSLEKTNVIGPTSCAETLINKKDDPHAIPMANIKDQFITEFLFIFKIFYLRFLVRSVSNYSYPLDLSYIGPIIRIGIVLASSIIPKGN